MQALFHHHPKPIPAPAASGHSRAPIPRVLSALPLLISALLGLSASVAKAQTGLSNVVMTAGTTIESAGQQRSYVALQSPNPHVLAGRTWAVFGKTGNPESPNPFTHRGTISPQTDAAAINSLLTQSAGLGQDLASLDNALAALLHQVPGITNQTVSQKLATAFQLAASDAALSETLWLLGNVHPGLNLCAGRAFSETINSVTTYEIRLITGGAPGDVLGRVTLVPGVPFILPAPGQAYQVMTNHPSDHLRIRLRWASPPELRRVSLLSYGFNVWRIPRAAAEAGNFHITPPTLNQLHSNPAFIRANAAPVFATMEYHPETIGSLTDRITYFFADDGRGTGVTFADGDEFYYFITARDLLGRDGLVASGGLARACRRLPPAPPREIRVENTVLPGSTNQPRLLVTWEQNTNAIDQITHYWIYRWSNPSMVFTNEAAPLDHRIGIIPHAPGTNLNAFLDNTTGALTNSGLSNIWYTVRAVSDAACDPLFSAHAGPAWGVLRQTDAPAATVGSVAGSCGLPVTMLTQLSTNALTGPNNTGRQFRFVCTRRDRGIEWVDFVIPVFPGVALPDPIPRIYFPPDDDQVEVIYTTPFAQIFDFTVSCRVGNTMGQISALASHSRTNPHPYASELQVNFLAGQVLSTALDSSDPLLTSLPGGVGPCLPGTQVTPDSSGMVSMQFAFGAGQAVLVQAQTNGIWTDVAVVFPETNGLYWVSYPACLVGPVPPFRGCAISLPGESDCAQHFVGGANDGPIAPVRVRFRLTPETREYRVYRRVNDGPFTLLAQGAAIYDPAQPSKVIEAKDDALPSTTARICYFVQLLNQHGFGSPLALIGCKEIKPPALPVPTLSEPIASGTVGQPMVSLNWFCPTSGVHRFQFKIQRADADGGTQPSGFVATRLMRDMTFNSAAAYAGLTRFRTSILAVEGRAATAVQRFDEAHLTSPIGPDFGPGPAFTLEAEVLANVMYLISVAAVDEQGKVGPSSVAWEFMWRPPVVLQNVPWPARPLPPAASSYVWTRVLTNHVSNYPNLFPQYHAAVSIGAASVSQFEYQQGLLDRDFIPVQPPTSVLYRTDRRQSILPAVLYRVQLTNALFPRVSGDIIQVSPLIETIAWHNPCLTGTFDGICSHSFVRDPLIRPIYSSYPGFGDTFSYDFQLFLLDAQPAVSGARYNYYLVRFNEKREPEDVLNAGEVTIP